MSGAYSALAAWFEYLNADCDYEKWSQYLYGRLLSLGVKEGKGLDIGCGSGAFTRASSGRLRARFILAPPYSQSHAP